MEDFEININFLNNYKSREELTKDHFKNFEVLFNIFDIDHNDKLGSKEINNIFELFTNSAKTNIEDKRDDQHTIFDSKEVEHFILNNTDEFGKSFKDLGINTKQIFNFLNILEQNREVKDDIGIVNEGKEFEAYINNIISFNHPKYANKEKILINEKYYTFDDKGQITHIYDNEDEDSLSTVIIYYQGKPKEIYQYNNLDNEINIYHQDFTAGGYYIVDDWEDAADILKYQYSRDALIYGMLDKSLTLESVKKVMRNEDPVNIMHGYLDADGRDDIEEFKHSLLGDIASLSGGVEFVNSIVQSKIQEAKNKNVNIEDVISDINSHPNDYKKLDIDLLRINGRINYNRSEGSDNVNISTLDGKLSDNISQNYATDDCFLVSSIITTSSNDLGADLLSKLRTNLSNGDIQIKCLGNNKTYTITQEELLNANYLSNGDLDMRVYEIALDRYRRDMAYENPIGKGCGGYSIDGGGCLDDVAMAFWGVNAKKTSTIDNKNCVYTFGFSPYISPEITLKAFDKNGQEHELYTQHTYAVKYFDEEYVYFVDPYDSSNLLHVKKQNLYNEKNVEIETLDLLEVKNKLEKNY